jgi:hypothetical protein
LGAYIGVPQIGNCSISGANTDVVNSGLAQLNNLYTGSGDTLNALAAGNSSFGVLSAEASASFDITGAPASAWAFGQATFTDLLTINFAPWTGQTGLLYVNYTLDGNVSSTGNGNACSSVELFAGPDTSTAQSRGQIYNSSASGVFSVGAPLDPYDRLGFAVDLYKYTYSCRFVKHKSDKRVNAALQNTPFSFVPHGE